MASLDVTLDVLADPLLTDTFTVQRRIETVGTNGRSATSTTTFSNVIGVVTAGSPNQLGRPENYEIQPRVITIVTKFRIQGEVTGNQPDIITWRGSHYVVRNIDLYPQFGTGFVQVECESMDHTDPALNPPSAGAFVFNQPTNSAYI